MTLPKRVLWRWSAEDRRRHVPFGDVVVANGVVVVATVDNVSPPAGFVTALDATDGTTRWELPIPMRPLLASDGQHVAVLSHRQLLWIEVDSGYVLWAKSVPISGHLMVAHDTIYIRGDRMLALSTADGSVKWESAPEPDEAAKSTMHAHLVPSAGQDCVFTYWPTALRISCLRASNGEEVWQRPLPESPVAPPVVCGNSVLIRTEHELLSLSVDRGRTLWSAELPDSAGCFPIAVRGETVYVAAGKVIHQLDLSSGSVVGHLSLPDDLPGLGGWPLLVTDEFLVFAGMRGSGARVHTKISIIDRQSDRVVWSRTPAPRDIPGQIAIADGRLFFASLNGVTASGP